MSALAKLATMLGIGAHQAEDSMHSERAARAVLTRRNLFAAGAAMASGAVFSFGAAELITIDVPTLYPKPITFNGVAFPIWTVDWNGLMNNNGRLVEGTVAT